MDKILIVLTNKYPYGSGESFIEPERKNWERFNHVFICPVLARKEEQIRNQFVCEQNETVIETFDEKLDFLDVMRKDSNKPITPRKTLSEIMTIKNVPFLFKSKMAYAMAVYTNLRINRIKKALSSVIENLNSSTRVLIYSYWMYEPALVGIGLKSELDNPRMITRAHGYDIYSERHRYNYIPFRQMIFEQVDTVYPISEDGKNYLSNEYNKKYASKIQLSRLGTIKKYPDYYEGRSNGNSITIVSCAYLVPLKRIHLIAESLKMTTKDILWVHFGGGEQISDVEQKVQELPGNVNVKLFGSVPNDVIQQYYSTHYVDAFVNVSETEGLPVSIMEAQSYGIPVIATDVGGTSELVINGKNGILLAKDFQLEELLGAIDAIVENAQWFRKNAKITWNENSDAAKNYKEFFDKELAEMNK